MALSAWEKLTSVVTLGTARAPVQIESLWPDPSIAHPSDSVEHSLLRVAAATYLWQAAGARAAPQSQASQRPPFEAAPSTQAKETAAWRLARMINGEHADLVSEWLAAARESSLVLPPQWLPVVLDALSPELREQFSEVLGPIGAWLASQDPRWAFRPASNEPSEERWTTGSLAERSAELKNLRATDPARAREWLQASWASDPPEAREQFLAILLVGLTSADEPFLEHALDDKRKGVRTAAVECLSRLANSAHAKRNLARLAPLIELEPKKTGLLSGLRRRKLEVRLPDAPDKAAQRDGVELKPPAARKIGERVFWLTQMVAMAPPQYWTEHFDCDAPTFIGAALATDFGPELLNALTDAVARHPNPEWLDALNAAWLESKADAGPIIQAISVLLKAAHSGQRMQLLEAQIRTLGVARFDIALGLLQTVDTSWSAALTRLALEQLREVSQRQRQQWSLPRNTLDDWARRCDVEIAMSMLSALLDACPADSPWRNALEQMNDTVEFRTAMLKELSP
jgi:hypothetical protein